MTFFYGILFHLKLWLEAKKFKLVLCPKLALHLKNWPKFVGKVQNITTITFLIAPYVSETQK